MCWKCTYQEKLEKVETELQKIRFAGKELGHTTQQMLADMHMKAVEIFRGEDAMKKVSEKKLTDGKKIAADIVDRQTKNVQEVHGNNINDDYLVGYLVGLCQGICDSMQYASWEMTNQVANAIDVISKIDEAHTS